MRNYKRAISLVLIFCFFALSLVGCGDKGAGEDKKVDSGGKEALAMTPFATYKPVEYQVKPAVPLYEIEADLANIANKNRFNFSEENSLKLQVNGFLVYPGYESEFHSIYEFSRYIGLPNFITTDAMLHSYHLVFDFILSDLESHQLTTAVQKLGADMLRVAEKQYDVLKGTEWETAAKINLAYFAVGNALIDPNAVIPEPVSQEVKAELAAIDAQEGIALSAVLNMDKENPDMDDYKEDYSQYIPRSHYTKNETLKQYFKTMMWYGRITFLLKDENASKAAILMSLAMKEGENAKRWQEIYDTTAFFAGVSDDVNAIQVADLVEKTYGKNPDLKEIAKDEDKYKEVVKDIAALQKPKINSIPIYEKETAQERQEEITGVRFMGQRYTIDGDIFQNLIMPAVEVNPQGEKRALPDRLDVAAAFGSKTAVQALREKGAYEYKKYPENMDKMIQYVDSLSRDEWHQNLYWAWMDMIRPLIKDKFGEGYPMFMQSCGWENKNLNAFLGSWTELKHDTLLYTKQVYAEMGGAPEPKYDDRGYVEPHPEIYARLAALSAFTRDGLKSRDMLSAHNEDLLNILEKLSLRLLEISIKELENQPLSEEDYELIRTFGGQLEHIWYESQIDRGSKDKRQLMIDNPAPIIADVATDPNGQVLEVATGYVWPIYVVVPVDDKLVVAIGGVFSTYQFPWPLDDRLTDEAWREMINYYDYDSPTPIYLEQENWQKVFQGTRQHEMGIIAPMEEDVF